MNDVRIVRPHERDAATAQTPGMARVAGVSAATCGSSAVWMGEVTTAPGFRSGAHHHGDVESAIYVLSGTYRFRWGEHLEHSAVGGAGDFIYVPARLVHQEINTSDDEPLVFILARGNQENIVVNVDVLEADIDPSA
ncbi:MAG: cupin domain-containing protein [Dehalococcoidia bacterium]